MLCESAKPTRGGSGERRERLAIIYDGLWDFTRSPGSNAFNISPQDRIDEIDAVAII